MSEKLCIPAKALNQHCVVLGKTGSGKSSALRHIVEWLLGEGKRVCIIDPKGDWWGLKVGADGKSAGFPVILFGDFKEGRKGDVPINEGSARDVADLIATGNRPCVIGFAGWTTGAMTRFWIEFAKHIFTANRGELFLVGDEFHNFAPKGKVLSPEAGLCLHWSNRLINEGRGNGFNCLIASQRPQKVHNDTLTACETLIAMRVIHASDRGAVKDWIDGCGSRDMGAEVLNRLASLKRGEAYVWSPEINFGPELITFPMFRTFDSFAPPQLQKRVSEAAWASVDLDEVKARLATVIEESKANDPRELKKQIAALQAQLKKVPTPVPAAPAQVEIKEVPILTKAHEGEIASILHRLEYVGEKFQEVMLEQKHIGESFKTLCAAIAVVKEHTSRPLPFPRMYGKGAGGVVVFEHGKTVKPYLKEADGADASGDLGKCERAILTALAQYPQGRSTNQIALLSGYSVSSGGFNNSLGSLRSKGFITRGHPAQATEAGLNALGQWDPLPTGDELVRYWLGKLDKCERAILEALLAHDDKEGLTKERIGLLTNYSATSGGFNNALGRLRTLELITRTHPIRLSEDFFQ